MKVLAISQARIGSRRLPAKVLQEVGGKSLLQVHLERVSQASLITSLAVATTAEPGADQILSISDSLHLLSYQGNLHDVLDRFYQVAVAQAPDLVVRVTADCPLIDPVIIDDLIRLQLRENLDYVSNTIDRSYPDGMDVEVFTFNALRTAWEQATLPSDREHVTPYIWRNSDLCSGSVFRAASLRQEDDFSHFRLTVDEQVDLDLIRKLVGVLGANRPWRDYVSFLMENPDVMAINAGIGVNEGYIHSLNQDAASGKT
nr:glycosyltransferase family protein [uncultured Chitinophaga sp.]